MLIYIYIFICIYIYLYMYLYIYLRVCCTIYNQPRQMSWGTAAMTFPWFWNFWLSSYPTGFVVIGGVIKHDGTLGNPINMEVLISSGKKNERKNPLSMEDHGGFSSWESHPFIAFSWGIFRWTCLITWGYVEPVHPRGCRSDVVQSSI